MEPTAIVILSLLLVWQLIESSRLRDHLAASTENVRSAYARTETLQAAKDHRLIIPSAEHALLPQAEYERLLRGIRGDEPLYLAFRMVVAQALTEAVGTCSSPALSDKPGSLAAAAGGVDVLAHLLGDLHHPERLLRKNGERKTPG